MEGFVYVECSSPGPFPVAAVGRRVATGSWDPPWLVVDHTLERVMVARWPGRLFRVRVIPPGSPAEREALQRAAQNLRPDAGYTRAFAVDVLEELPAASLFGPHGDAVADVIAAGTRLLQHDMERLAAARHPDADEAYSRAWDAWLAEQPNGQPYLGHNAHTLAAPGAGPVGSPVGHALSLVCLAVEESARLRAGGTAFATHPEDYPGEEAGEEYLVGPWADARSALCDIAMALGAPHLLEEDDRAVLLTAWHDSASGSR